MKNGFVVAAMAVWMMGCASSFEPSGVTAKPNMSASAPPAKAPSRPPAPAPPAPLRTTRLGQSVQGRPIDLVSFGPATGRPVLIIGGIHGSEPTSVYVAEQLVTLLRLNPGLAKRPVAIIANANPDALAARKRGNANGVDVNRNFPAKNWRPVKTKSNFNGTAPSTEPESRAIQQAIESLQPDRIISIHSITRGRHCNNYDGPGRWLAEAMYPHNGYPVTATIGYPTPGSLGSWAGIDRQIPMVTLELPREDSGEIAWKQNRDALLAAIAVPRPR